MITLLSHNQPAFQEISDSYKNGTKKIIYVSGVGTGKSFVFLAMAEQMKGRILYILPKHAIRENIEAYGDYSAVEGKVSFVTFNKFTTLEKSRDIINGYEMVVIDECHHLGSDVYGRTLLQAMSEDNERYYLGLTATPVRFKMDTTLPDGKVEKDVDISQFFEKRVDGISNFDAIRLGLMPPFQYRLLEPDKDPRQIEKEYGYEVKAVVDYKNGSYDIVKEIVSTYPRDKWICFFSSAKELHNHEDDIRDMFPGYEIFLLYSDLRNLKVVMDGVKRAEKAVILSINMLLEGVHLSGITGIILYRNVTSVSTFQQILGRVCSIGNKTEPLIIDCSKCGPKLLKQLLNEGEKGSGKWEQSSAKPIMSIGIGTHRGWEQVDMFLARLASLKQKQEKFSDEIKDLIIKDYLMLGGNETGNILKLNKKDKALFDACCWKHGINSAVFLAHIKEIKK